MERSLLFFSYLLVFYGIPSTFTFFFLQIFNPSVLQRCTKVERKAKSTQTFTYYKDTNEAYSSLASTAGLEISLKTGFSLGLSLEYASKGLSEFARSVTGNSLLIQASYGRDMLDERCLLDGKNFDGNFLEQFRNLPVEIQDPWYPNAWKHYDVFLNTYGSHVVSSALLGSSINQMVFAETDDSYKAKDFKIGSCLALAGPKNVTDLGVSVCSGIHEEDISKVSKMSMNEHLVVRGGLPITRNELIKHRTADLIETFLNEAEETRSAIEYTLTSLWRILQALFVGKHTGDFIRAVNLEYYYLGFLNYGCDYRYGGGQDLQMFNFAEGSSATSPQYECSLAPEGCHSNKDCHRKGLTWCSCKGPSCVAYTDIKLNYDCNGKTTAVINTETDWEGHGCEISRVHCYCKNPSEERKTVWKIDHKRALFQAHYVSLKRNITERKDEL